MPRTKNKLLKEDTRQIPGMPIHAKVTTVLSSETECRRIYGNTGREVNGDVVRVEFRTTKIGRKMKYVVGRFIIGNKTKDVAVPLGQVMAGDSKCYPRSVEQKITNSSQTQTTIVDLTALFVFKNEFSSVFLKSKSLPHFAVRSGLVQCPTGLRLF